MSNEFFIMPDSNDLQRFALTTDDDKIAVLRELLSDPSGWTGDPNLDLVRNLATEVLGGTDQPPENVRR